MKKLTLLLLIALSPFVTHSQLDSVYHEVVTTDDGAYPDYPAGHSTYRIYAALSDDFSWLTAVGPTTDSFISLGCQEGEMFNSDSGDGSPIAGTEFFLNIFNQNLAYDSYVTIGADGTADDLGVTVDYVSPNMALQNSLGTPGVGPAIIDENVAWWSFWSPNQTNGFGVGESNRVLLAQITCPSDIQYRLVTLVERFNDNEEIGPDYVDTWDPLDSYDPDNIEVTYNPTLAYPQPSFIGCTDPTACNYDTEHTYDDGSCEYPGCTDELACNYDASAACADASCIYILDAVVDLPNSNWDLSTPSILDPCVFDDQPIVFNNDQTGILPDDPFEDFRWSLCLKTLTVGELVFDYIPAAGIFYNSSQTFVIKPQNYDPFNDCVADLDGDGSIDASDLLTFLSAFGTVCSEE
ncbi:MAG: hypothetical protein MK081_14465 [Flavobacteriales bacterium]|nr:hypothetical protein [Flavobacteriales bacterium]